MFEKNDFDSLARIAVPGAVAAFFLWLLGVFGAKQSVVNPLLLFSVYLLGAGMLITANKALKLTLTPSFYLAYCFAAFVSGPVAVALFGQNPTSFFGSFAMLTVVMFVMPGAFMAIEEKLKETGNADEN